MQDTAQGVGEEERLPVYWWTELSMWRNVVYNSMGMDGWRILKEWKAMLNELSGIKTGTPVCQHTKIKNKKKKKRGGGGMVLREADPLPKGKPKIAG